MEEKFRLICQTFKVRNTATQNRVTEVSIYIFTCDLLSVPDAGDDDQAHSDMEVFEPAAAAADDREGEVVHRQRRQPRVLFQPNRPKTPVRQFLALECGRLISILQVTQ